MVPITQPQSNTVKALYQAAISPILDKNWLTKEQADELYTKLLTFEQKIGIMSKDTFKGFSVGSTRIANKDEYDYDYNTHLVQLSLDEACLFKGVYWYGEILTNNIPVEITVARQVDPSMDATTSAYRIVLEF